MVIFSARSLEVTLPCTAPKGLYGPMSHWGTPSFAVSDVAAEGALVGVVGLVGEDVLVVAQKLLGQIDVDLPLAGFHLLFPARMTSIRRSGEVGGVPAVRLILIREASRGKLELT